MLQVSLSSLSPGSLQAGLPTESEGSLTTGPLEAEIHISRFVTDLCLAIGWRSVGTAVDVRILINGACYPLR